MKRLLFIHLLPETRPVAEAAESPVQASWVVVEEGHAHGVMHGTLMEAAAFAAGGQVIVCIPGETVILHSVELPGRNRQQLLKLLPYALEDLLIDDVETQHFALGPRDEDGRYAVAVISHVAMQQWCELLDSAGIRADMLIPDVLALPRQSEQWTVMLDGERTLARLNGFTGFATEYRNLAAMLGSAVQSAGETLPEAIDIYDCRSGGGETELAESSAMGVTTRVHACQEPATAWLASHFDPACALNLLHGEYSRRDQIGTQLRPWYPAAAMLAIWLLLQAGLYIYEYVRLGDQVQVLRKQMEQVYRVAYPKARKIVDPYQQMKSGLESLRKGSGKSAGSFQEMLTSIAPILQTTGKMKIISLHYRDGRMELDIELAGNDFRQLDALKEKLLAQEGWQVDVSGSSRKDKLQGKIQIRSAG